MRSGVILHLWHANPNLLLRGFIDVHNADQDNISKIMGICQESKVIPGAYLVMIPQELKQKYGLNL